MTPEEKQTLVNALQVYQLHLGTVEFAKEFGDPLGLLDDLQPASQAIRSAILINYRIPEIARALFEICPDKEPFQKVMNSIHG